MTRAWTGTALAGALLGGLLGTAQPAAAATPAVPSWVVPLLYQSPSGTLRSCTGITLSPQRTLVPPDCFSGRSDADVVWRYSLSTGQRESGEGNPSYRTHPQFNVGNRQAAIGVQQGLSPYAATSTPVLAGSGDTSLYTAGATATFHSWSGSGSIDGQRVRHSEQVVVRRSADCAAAFGLGSSLPTGIICTSAAPGTPMPDPNEQCAGDSGGALVAGGKLVAVSATGPTSCVRAGMRLYTAVPTYRAVVEEWTRDVGYFDWRQPGSILGQEPVGVVDVLEARTYAKDPVDSSGMFLPPIGTNLVLQAGDLNGDRRADLIARTSNGTLYRLPVTTTSNTGSPVNLGTGWGRYNRMLAMRDMSGDGRPDVVGRDGNGDLWMHPGNGAGGFGTRLKIGVGWGGFNTLAGRSDLSGDARPDLLARDANGDVWLYRGNGKGGFLPRTKIGAGWKSFNAIVASGDFDDDGRQDVIARTSTGAAYLYNANNTGGLTAPKLITSYWKRYTALT
ncbi:FG-GAP-like repeat-containing protein [Streptomyces sp. NBC_00191]|uniref:FG-GAP repeat domain-containing protein n=1 Tax=Streptomyces sp. NBC_00191 TaxID=2975674 RepID=UPI0032444D0E